jgi:hypothetical protein
MANGAAINALLQACREPAFSKAATRRTDVESRVNAPKMSMRWTELLMRNLRDIKLFMISLLLESSWGKRS